MTTQDYGPAKPRGVRSYVRRHGRVTDGQQRAIEQLWSTYGIRTGNGRLELDALFGRRAGRVLEIGFGMGDQLLALAAADPATDFIGVDVYRPGIGRLLAGIERLGLTNVRVAEADAMVLLRDGLCTAALRRVLLLFPDPWPKKRHRKRRLVQPEFIELVGDRLCEGGILHLATDWQSYAEQMLALLDTSVWFENLAGPGRFSDAPDYRVQTKFERRGRVLGHGVRDLLYRRRGATVIPGERSDAGH